MEGSIEKVDMTIFPLNIWWNLQILRESFE